MITNFSKWAKKVAKSLHLSGMDSVVWHNGKAAVEDCHFLEMGGPLRYKAIPFSIPGKMIRISRDHKVLREFVVELIVDGEESELEVLNLKQQFEEAEKKYFSLRSEIQKLG